MKPVRSDLPDDKIKIVKVATEMKFLHRHWNRWLNAILELARMSPHGITMYLTIVADAARADEIASVFSKYDIPHKIE